jgi:hypothetical protein
MMSGVSRNRTLTVLLAGLAGFLFAWQADIHVFIWRAVVTGFAAAFAGAALLSYAQVIRLTK